MPPAPCLPAIHTPRAFSDDDAARILSLARAGEVHVISAAPGQGKSTRMRVEIAARLIDGTLSQVLWAVQAIEGEESLGQEALEHFRALGIHAEIVYRDDHVGLSKADYAAQFGWPTRSTVKIISHARLPQIFAGGSHLAAKFKDAELLIIDEDPSGGLLLASANTPPSRVGKDPDLQLSSLSLSLDPVCVALASLAKDAERGGTAVSSFTQRNTFNKGYGLYGDGLAPHLAGLHQVDTVSLAKALRKARLTPEDAQLVAAAFAEDAERAATPGLRSRMRLGLHWSGGKTLTAPGYLRFNLRRPLTFQQPVIVLDGYADAAFYAALFREQAPLQFHTFDPGPKLDVEYDERLYIDPMKDINGLSQQRHKLVTEELAEQKARNSGRQQLLLMNKDLQQPGTKWSKLLSATFAGHPTSSAPDNMHWHAGRGRNDKAGFDVYALSPPLMSAMYTSYTLADVFPDDPAERQRMRGHSVSTELLQMLNRGRQPHDPTKPRIILATTLERATDLLGTLKSRVELRPFKPILHFEKRSSNPRWRGMMGSLIGELLEHFPEGVPMELIGALPKYCPKTKAQTQAGSGLKALAKRCPTDSHLYRAFHDTAAWPYHDVPGGGGSTNKDMLNHVLKELGLSILKKMAMPLPHAPGDDGRDAKAAYREFQTWGKTALLPSPHFSSWP